jgi:hypothetical protein
MSVLATHASTETVSGHGSLSRVIPQTTIRWAEPAWESDVPQGTDEGAGETFFGAARSQQTPDQIALMRQS